MKKQNLQKKNAFSLVELAIVIIIIGLLIAGIMGGASLIKSATLRAVVSESQNYKVAANAFKTKYNFFPGDYNQVLYGDAPEGNGDGNINIEDVGTSETVLAISHLVADNSLDNSLFSGDYVKLTVAQGFAFSEFQVGATNVFNKAPRGKLNNSIWVLTSDGDLTNPKNVALLTKKYDTTSGTVAEGAISGVSSYADALALDTMADDGDLTTGFVNRTSTLCDANEPDTVCSLSFSLEFFGD